MSTTTSPLALWSDREEQTLADVAAAMDNAPYNVPPTKHTKALDAVKADRVSVHPDAEGSYQVRGNQGQTYETITGACTCKWGTEHPDDRYGCYHAVAGEMYHRWQRAMIQMPEPVAHGFDTSLPALSFPETLTVQLALPEVTLTHQGSVMTEAPYSATVSVEDEHGFEWLLTVRKVQGNEFTKAITQLGSWCKEAGLLPKKRFVRELPPPATEAASPPQQGPPICQYHGAMKESTKAKGTFFCSAKMGDGSYCKSKA